MIVVCFKVRQATYCIVNFGGSGHYFFVYFSLSTETIRPVLYCTSSEGCGIEHVAL